MPVRIDRRTFLEGSAAALGVGLCTGLHPTQADAQAGRPIEIPTIDRLAVRVVLDSSHDIFIREEKPKGVVVERVRGLPPPRTTKTLHNEWGLSLLLESEKGSERRSYLLDFGYTAEVLNHNIDLLDVDPGKLNGLILSHGHYDHFGGLIGFLAKHRARMPDAVTLYAGGEENFCIRHTRRPGGLAEWGALDRARLKEARVELVLAEQPSVIDGHAFTTGAIPRAGIEKVLPNTMVEYRMRESGLGCNAAHFAAAELQGKIVLDEHWHEHATCFNVKDRGLVVITSCGHVGILNTIRRAQELSGISKVHALVGGFHLAPAPAPYLTQIMGELAKADVEYVIPMHCSGMNFVSAMQARMPEKLLLSSTGSRFVFGV